MSRIRQTLRTYLLDQSALTALVGTRIYQSRVPKGDTPLQNFPAIVYRRMTGGHEHDLDGSAGVARARFQVTVVGTDAIAVDDICEQLRQAMQGFRGQFDTTRVTCVTLNDEVDDYIESTIGDDVGFYLTMLVYTVSHIETKPTFV